MKITDNTFNNFIVFNRQYKNELGWESAEIFHEMGWDINYIKIK